MLKGGYTFEKYFVALPYIWGSWWPINGCCDQWSQSLACSLTYGSEPLVSQNALLVRREYPGNPSGKHIMHANGHNRMIVSTDPVVKKLTPWAIWRIVMRQNGNLNLTWQTPHQWQKGGGGGGGALSVGRGTPHRCMLQQRTEKVNTLSMDIVVSLF